MGTDTDINLINPMVIQVMVDTVITPMATIPTATKSQCMADMTTTDTSQPMADITRILTEDTGEVIQKILTVEVFQKILTEDMADIKRIRTGDMAEINCIPTDTKNITEPSTIPTTLKLP